ncbi:MULTISPECIES: helix-turn-helix domain-containing protein [unclassified Caballeronia]|uniref:helix-turn-helix domain-containing protein n=1 Tax=unclassified Caballeronia TaxID=2646786 RepID=UPI0020299E3C|nr:MULTISPECIES: helix-turn-helix domain-containing protein [unclassified Caballeronia]
MHRTDCPVAMAEHDCVVRVKRPRGLRKAPRQARSVALVTALKQTGRSILENEGREALTALRVAESAGVAISSLYEYFPTMDALIGAVFDDYRNESRDALLAGIAALPPSATLFDGILLTLTVGLGVHRKKMLLDPAFNVRSIHYDELVRLDLVKAEEIWHPGATPALMARFQSEIRVRDAEKARFMVLHTLLALPRAMVLERPDYLAAPDTPYLLARMIHALLTTESR